MVLQRIPAAPPRALLLLLVATAIFGAAWTLIVPPWQAPDEHAHFAYAQTLAESGKLPEGGRRSFSTEQTTAASAVNSDQLAQNLFARPEWSEPAYERWRAQQAILADSARADGGGSNPAGTNPPLYYAFESIPYLAAADADLFGRLYLMRLWSVLLLLVAVAATWLLVGEVFGARRDLQLAGASVVALQPMATFISASVSPDSLLIAAFALSAWLGARVIRRGLSFGTGAALCAAVAIGILAKATGYALVPATILAIFIGARRSGLANRPRELMRAAPASLALLVPVGAWLAYAFLSDRPAVNQIGGGASSGMDQPGFLSYLWQFYLPHLPWQQPLPPSYPPLPMIDLWIEGAWGKFGWLEIVWPGPLYVVAAAVTAALLAAGAVAVVQSGVRRHLPMLIFLLLIAVALVGGVHLAEYRILEHQGIVFNQGRYLLPLLPLLGLAGAAALSLATGRRRQPLAGALLGFLLSLQFVSLAIVGARFYA